MKWSLLWQTFKCDTRINITIGVIAVVEVVVKILRFDEAVLIEVVVRDEDVQFLFYGQRLVYALVLSEETYFNADS